MDRKPRVLQICHDFKGPFGMVARQYATCFADCDIRTIFLRGAKSEEIAADIPGDVSFLALGPGSLRGLKLGVAAQVTSLIGDQVPDIVIAHRYKPFFVALQLRARMSIPLILGVAHEFGFLRRPGRAILTRFWPGEVRLLGVSEPVCQEICRRVPRLSSRVHHISHATEVLPILESTDARQRLGIPPGNYCFGVIGRLVHKKNHELLIRAFAELDGDPVLAIVGDGVLRDELTQLAIHLRLGERVIFCGHQDKASSLMKAFDTFVLPSGPEEAFGMVLLEAMAAQIPILSTDAPGPKSVLGEAGITFRSGDREHLTQQLRAIRDLTTGERTELTAEGTRRLQEEFSQEAMSQQLRNIAEVARLAPGGVEADV